MEKNVTKFNKSYSNNSLLQTNNSNTNSLSTTSLLKNKMVVKIHDASYSAFQTPLPLNTSSTQSQQQQQQLITQTSASSILDTSKLDNNNNNTRSNDNLNKTSLSVNYTSASANDATSFESSLIQIHKFFKEQKIYTDPNDNYKRRTIVLIRSNTGTDKRSTNSKNYHNTSDSSLLKSYSSNKLNKSNLSNCNANSEGEFGFNLQSYGLLNSHSKQTEYICFVNNVQPKSPAKRAGLNNGDVLLAIDGMRIDEFRSFNEIMKHVKGKNELRLVVMAENVCKKIKCQQRIEQIKKILTEKKADLERLGKQEDLIFKKYGIEKLKLINSSINKSQVELQMTPKITKLGSDNNNAKEGF